MYGAHTPIAKAGLMICFFFSQRFFIFRVVAFFLMVNSCKFWMLIFFKPFEMEIFKPVEIDILNHFHHFWMLIFFKPLQIYETTRSFQITRSMAFANVVKSEVTSRPPLRAAVARAY